MDGDEGTGGIEDSNREQAVPHTRGKKGKHQTNNRNELQRKKVYEIENGST